VCGLIRALFRHRPVLEYASQVWHTSLTETEDPWSGSATDLPDHCQWRHVYRQQWLELETLADKRLIQSRKLFHHIMDNCLHSLLPQEHNDIITSVLCSAEHLPRLLANN